MNKTTLGMALAALILMAIAFFKGGFELVGRGLLASGKTLLGVFPLIIIAFILHQPPSDPTTNRAGLFRV